MFYSFFDEMFSCNGNEMIYLVLRLNIDNVFDLLNNFLKYSSKFYDHFQSKKQTFNTFMSILKKMSSCNMPLFKMPNSKIQF